MSVSADDVARVKAAVEARLVAVEHRLGMLGDGTLCGGCAHRRASLLNCMGGLRTRLRRMAEGDALAVESWVMLDPAPKAECKYHEGYGEDAGTRGSCDDYDAL